MENKDARLCAHGRKLFGLNKGGNPAIHHDLIEPRGHYP
jgi:hypothetical protein